PFKTHRSMPQIPTAIVTGGARGIGYATAEVLGRDGYAIVLADLDADAAAEAASRLEAAGYTAVPVRTDVADPQSVQDLVAEVVRRFGRIDVLVNNAGIAGRAAPIHEVTIEEWDTLMAIDLRSVFLCCRAV